MSYSLIKRLSCALLLLGAGCRFVDVDYSDDGSWRAKYYSYGVWTSLGFLDVSVSTNGTVRLKMDDLNSDVSTNHVTIVDSNGKVLAEVTSEIIGVLAK